MLSVNSEERSRLCQMIAEVQARGDPDDALVVDCAYLNAAEVVEQISGSPVEQAPSKR